MYAICGNPRRLKFPISKLYQRYSLARSDAKRNWCVGKIESFWLSSYKSALTTTVPTKSLLTIKRDGSYKARVVAAGNLDPEKYKKNDTKSPTPSHLTIKWFFALAIRKGWFMEQNDVESAFLQGEVNRVKYIRIPPGFEGDNKTQVGKLHRPLNGLAIAPMDAGTGRCPRLSLKMVLEIRFVNHAYLLKTWIRILRVPSCC